MREFLVIIYDKHENEIAVERIELKDRKPKRSEASAITRDAGGTYYKVEEEIYKPIKRFHKED